MIPARGGSKGIPGKNLQRVNGRTLVSRSVSAALRSGCFSDVYVSTDDPDIADEAAKFGASPLMRPMELARDESTSESVLLHHLRQGDDSGSDFLAFLQCTSPFVSIESLRNASNRISEGMYQSVFSSTADHTFQWRMSADGNCQPHGHDQSLRARRQDLPPIVSETGGFYFMSSQSFLREQTRFCGRVGTVAVSKLESLEIDTFEDLAMAQQLAKEWDRGSRVNED